MAAALRSWRGAGSGAVSGSLGSGEMAIGARHALEGAVDDRGGAARRDERDCRVRRGGQAPEQAEDALDVSLVVGAGLVDDGVHQAWEISRRHLVSPPETIAHGAVLLPRVGAHRTAHIPARGARA